jgi:hypothetical protein
MSEQEKIKELEKENSFLKNRLRLYEEPSPVRAYYVGQKLLNQQVDYLKNFEFADEIKKNPKDDKVYDRSMDVFEKLTGNATKLNNLRSDLSLSGDESKDTNSPKYRITTSESIANVLGNTAGQNH